MNAEVPMLEMMEVEIGFRTKKDEATGAETKRPSVTVKYPVPTISGVIATLGGDPESKVVKMLKDSIDGILYNYVRTTFVDPNPEFTQDVLDAAIQDGKISLDFIANLPRSERNVISKEDLEAFAKDYIALMPGITKKTLAKIQVAAGLFVERFKKVAGDNDILALLKDQLEVFFTNVPEEVQKKHEVVGEYFLKKLEELLSVKVTADSL